jgi:hypothetical protein
MSLHPHMQLQQLVSELKNILGPGEQLWAKLRRYWPFVIVMHSVEK